MGASPNSGEEFVAAYIKKLLDEIADLKGRVAKLDRQSLFEPSSPIAGLNYTYCPHIFWPVQVTSVPSPPTSSYFYGWRMVPGTDDSTPWDVDTNLNSPIKVNYQYGDQPEAGSIRMAFFTGTFSDVEPRYGMFDGSLALLRVELQDELTTNSGTCTAREVVTDGEEPLTYNDVAPTFNLIDYTKKWCGSAGRQGWAVRKGDSGLVELVVLSPISHVARKIQFELPDTLTQSDASMDVEVTAYWDGTDPGTMVTVLNRAVGGGYSYEGPLGATGLAELRFNDDCSAGGGDYYIYDLDCDPLP